MNYRVIKYFIAREDCKEYKAGDTFACLDPARADFLIEQGFIAEEKAQEEPKPEKKEPQKAKAVTKRTTKKKA